MEAILGQLGLSTLLERFQEEKIDPHVVLSMTESCLTRLGVVTIGDRVRIKELCKQSTENCSTSSSGRSEVSTINRTPVQRITEERRQLFQPYQRSRDRARGQSGSAGRVGKQKSSSRRTWTGQFLCLADRHAFKTPSSAEKQILQQAGLGTKKI